MALPVERLIRIEAEDKDLVDVGPIIGKIFLFLANSKLFPNPQINRFMSQVVQEVLGTEEENPTSPWLITRINGNDLGLKTTVEIDSNQGDRYLTVTAGFSRLKEVELEEARCAIADLISQLTVWFTWERQYGPTRGPRYDWAKSRKESFLKTVGEDPDLLKSLINYATS